MRQQHFRDTPSAEIGAAQIVEFENTNYLGRAKKYSRLMVPTGGYIYPGFDFNPSNFTL